MKSSLIYTLVALALLFTSARVSFAAVTIRPVFSFTNKAAATEWGLQVMALKKEYESTDPQVSKAARAQVEKLAADFQIRYKTQWPTAEKAQKLQVFTENLWQVGQINSESNRAGGWWAALTKFADLSDQEFTDKYLMKDFREPALSPTFSPMPVAVGNGVDWSSKGKLTSVKDQKSCGSCWAFAANAALESRYLIQKGLNALMHRIDLSEQQLVDCVSSPRTSTAGATYNSTGCAGGWSTEAFDYVRKFNVTLETSYPYTATNGACKQRVLTSSSALATSFKQNTPDPGFYQVTPSNVTAIKAAVAYTPLAFYIRVEGAFKLYSGGVYDTACTGTKLNHAMLVFGWWRPLTAGSQAYYLVKNSWGTDWGEAGKAKILMDTSSSGMNDGLCFMHKYNYYPNAVGVYLP